MRESQAIHKITTTLLGYLALRLPNQPIALKYIQKKIIVSQSPANINYNNQIITRIKVRFLITLSFLGIPEEDQ
jgi:hypothetical protein